MQEKPITRGQIAAFSLPSIPVAALSLPLIVYLPPFYTQDVGLNFTIVGMIFMLVRLADVAADPMIGFVTDKFPSRWGRRRHWLAISVPLLMVTTWLLFMPIMPVTALQLTLVLFVLYISWSLLAITHMSWGAELSDDYNERSTIQGARTAMLIFGMLTVLALPAIIERTAGVTSGFDKMAAMGWFIVIFTPLTVFVASRITGERKHVRHEQHIPWRKAWAILLRNKILLRLLLANLLVGVGPGITGVLYIFFTTHVFGLGQSASFLLLIYFAAGFLGVPLWIKLSHKIGKHRTLSIAMIYGALTLPMLLILPHENFWWFCGANILYGLAFGATSFLPLSVLADVTDYDNLETGQQRTGLYFSLLSMTARSAPRGGRHGLSAARSDRFRSQGRQHAGNPEPVDGNLYRPALALHAERRSLHVELPARSRRAGGNPAQDRRA